LDGVDNSDSNAISFLFRRIHLTSCCLSVCNESVGCLVEMSGIEPESYSFYYNTFNYRLIQLFILLQLTKELGPSSKESAHPPPYIFLRDMETSLLCNFLFRGCYHPICFLRCEAYRRSIKAYFLCRNEHRDYLAVCYLIHILYRYNIIPVPVCYTSRSNQSPVIPILILTVKYSKRKFASPSHCMSLINSNMTFYMKIHCRQLSTDNVEIMESTFVYQSCVFL